MKQEWDSSSVWFWLVLLALLFVNGFVSTAPVVALPLLFAEIVIGVRVMRDNPRPSPHNTLGFALIAVGIVFLAAAAIVGAVNLGTTGRLNFSVPSQPAFYHPYNGGPFDPYEPWRYKEPTAIPQLLRPEKTADFGLDPMIIAVTQTMSAQTALFMGMTLTAAGVEGEPTAIPTLAP